LLKSATTNASVAAAMWWTPIALYVIAKTQRFTT